MLRLVDVDLAAGKKSRHGEPWRRFVIGD